MEWPPKTEKTLAIQQAASAIMGHEHNVFDFADCASCDKKDLKPEDFKDEVSRREFGISRMCQNCQDKLWGSFSD